MKLYHYTSHLHLPYILRQGISMGDIPLTRSFKLGEATGVWLTTSQERRGQAWAGRRSRTQLVDKTAIRLTVDIPDLHLSQLQKWSEYAELHSIEPSWKKALEDSGGGAEEAAQWHIFDGVILRRWIVEVKDLKPQTYSTAQRKMFAQIHKVNREVLSVKAAREGAHPTYQAEDSQAA